jgi:hypothetical protein
MLESSVLHRFGRGQVDGSTSSRVRLPCTLGAGGEQAKRPGIEAVQLPVGQDHSTVDLREF